MHRILDPRKLHRQFRRRHRRVRQRPALEATGQSGYAELVWMQGERDSWLTGCR